MRRSRWPDRPREKQRIGRLCMSCRSRGSRGACRTRGCLRFLLPMELRFRMGGLNNVQRFRGGLVFKSHRRCVSLNFRLESKNEEEKYGLTPPFERQLSCGRERCNARAIHLLPRELEVQRNQRPTSTPSSFLLSRLELSDTQVYEP